MSKSYSIDLYFPIERTKDALIATMNFVRITGDTQTRVVLPDGDQLVVPVTSNLKFNQTVVLEKVKQGITLDLILCFPLDAEVNKYYQEAKVRLLPDQLGAPVGYIYLWIDAGHQFVSFSYTAATSSMSLLLANSNAVHQRFLEILNAAGGIIALIFVEEYECPILGSTDQKIISPDEETYWFESEDTVVEDINRKLEFTLGQIPDNSQIT
jgi:hypothetical protein